MQVAAIWRTVMVDCMYQISLQTWIQYFSKEIDDTFREMVLSAMERSLQLQEVSCLKECCSIPLLLMLIVLLINVGAALRFGECSTSCGV